MSSSLSQSVQDPAKISQLFDKIEKSNNVEIEERSIKNLHQKLSHKLIDGTYIAQNHAQQLGSIFKWINKRQESEGTLGSAQALLMCLQILKYISQKPEGKHILSQYECVEFLHEFSSQAGMNMDIQTEVDAIMRNLIQDQANEQQQYTLGRTTVNQQNNVFNQNLKSATKDEQAFSQISERFEDPMLEDDHILKSALSTKNRGGAETISFNRKEFKMAVTNINNESMMKSGSQMNKTSQSMMSQARGVESSHMDLMHKQQVLKEQCELPFVMLTEDDEKVIFDIGVQLKFGNFENVLLACQKIQNLTFFDYPIEVLLQRTDILKALLDLLEGSQGFVFTNLAQQSLLVFVSRLKNLYNYLGMNVNKPSHIPQNERDQSLPMEPYLEYCYPSNNMMRWNSVEEQLSDSKKYGTNFSAATTQNSLSCRAALGLIITKTIYLMKDSEKIGLYIQLFTEALDVLKFIYRVEQNNAFTELLHLCLFAFDSVCEFYKDQIFDEVLIQPIISQIVKLVELLNTIPQCDDKFKNPFTQTFYTNTENLQRILRRSLFRQLFGPNEKHNSHNEEQILLFFHRLEKELQNVNLLQKNVTHNFRKGQEAYQKFQKVCEFKINNKAIYDGDIQNKNGGIIFVQNMTQYYQAQEILNELSSCVEIKLDFPFEDLLLDCMVFGMLANDSNLDGKLEKTEDLVITYLQIPLPEVRERILRKMYQRIRVASVLSLNNKKEVNNNVLLSNFVYRKKILSQFINGTLLNKELANEETKLQLTIGQLVIKILILGYNEGGLIAQKTNLNPFLLTFQSLLPQYPDLIGLIDLIEESSNSRSCRLLRLLRDLFNYDSQKREFSTSVLRSSFSKDCQELLIKDILKETVDLQKPSYEVSLELELVNQNYDYSTIDIFKIQSILQSQVSDFAIKKSCLEQLSMLLFDTITKKGKMLFKNNQAGLVKDLFTFVVEEVISSYQTCQTYLRQQVQMLEQSQVLYLKECLRFIFLSYITFNDEEIVKQFFNNIKLMSKGGPTQSNQEIKANQGQEQYENLLNALLFFMGSTNLRANALNLIFVSVFHPLFLYPKTNKQKANNSQVIRKHLTLVVMDFSLDTFIMLVPYTPQAAKQPLREDLALSEEQKMFIAQKQNESLYKSEEVAMLKQIAQNFTQTVQNKNEDFNQVIRGFETIQNYVNALQEMKDQLINVSVMNSLTELLKVLPTRDFEYNFLADLIMIINQILHSYKQFDRTQNLELFLSKLTESLKFHLIPYIIETGLANLENKKQVNQSAFSPKIYFMHRFLELINQLALIDVFLKQKTRSPSALQDKIINNNMIQYLVELYAFFKDGMEFRKKILTFFFTRITSYDIKALQLEELPDLLVNQVASFKLTLLFANSSVLMTSIRALNFIHQKRLIHQKKQVNDLHVSAQLSQTSLNYLQKYSSFGWIIRFIESRDSRVRVLCWDLISEIFDYEFLKSHASIVQMAVNNYLKNKELYCVKISILRFLNKVCESLIYNCDITREESEQQQLHSENFICGQCEAMSVSILLNTINKQGLISQVQAMLAQKDCPLLFLTLTLKLLHKLTLMDSKKALAVLTQLDYWTQLVELVNIKGLNDIDTSENRNVIQSMQKTILRPETQTNYQDLIYMTLNSLLEFIAEAFKRDVQLANLLVKTTRLLPQLFQILQTTVNQYKFDQQNHNSFGLGQQQSSNKGLQMRNKALLIIFIDKITKILHLALMHPQEYTLDVLKKFLFEQAYVDIIDNSEQDGLIQRSQYKPRNWMYIIDMFKIINGLSVSSYFYGHVDVKLAIARFISEFLIRLPKNQDNYLDELVQPFDYEKYANQGEQTNEMESYGSIFLLEMGSIFKALYIDKQLPSYARGLNSQPEDYSEQENTKIDITQCLSILLALSKSAKTAAIEHNLVKKIVEICNENCGSLQLNEIQKVSTKKGPSNKSTGATTTFNKTSQADNFSSIRQYKYAQSSDIELCSREIIRMLQIIRHLFFGSAHLLTPFIFNAQLQQSNILQQSKIQSNISMQGKKKTQLAKKTEQLGEKIVQMFIKVIDEIGGIDSQKYEQLIQECLLAQITFASQNVRFKNAFIQSFSQFRSSLLKVTTDHILKESLHSNSKRMKLEFVLLRSLSMSNEVAKELMKMKTIEEIISQIQPVCKNEKDIKLMKHYLSNFASFLAGYASTDDGQKHILKLKPVFELVLFLLDTAVPHTTSGVSQIANMLTYLLLFLRNTSFTRSNKLHFLSNPQFLPCLLAFLTSQVQSEQQPRIKAYASSCLWVLLYNHQGVKAMLNKETVINELQSLKQEYQRSCDIGTYQHYVTSKSSKQITNDEGGQNLIMNQKRSEENSYLMNKRMNDFVLQSLNGILALFQLQQQQN